MSIRLGAVIFEYFDMQQKNVLALLLGADICKESDLQQKTMNLSILLLHVSHLSKIVPRIISSKLKRYRLILVEYSIANRTSNNIGDFK